jgi:branched-chain amino acid transport system permease protein
LDMSRKLLINILSIIFLAAVIIALPITLGSVYWTSVLVIMGINILLVSSLRTLKLVGHISLGHVGFSLIGAYGSALLVMKVGLSFWISIFLGGLMAAVIALALAYPFLRVKGIYFVLLTLLTAETFRLIARYWPSLTGGVWGLLKIPPPNPITIPMIGTITFDSANNYYYLAAVIVSLSLFVLYRLESSRLGFKWRIIQDSEVLAQSVGINVMWHKALNFAIASFFAGIAGALFAHYQHALSPQPTARFGLLISIYLVVYMVVGGESKFAGPIIGTVFLTIVSELARGLGEYRPIMIGAIAILTMLFMPEGLIGLPKRVKLWYRKLLKPKREAQGPT